MHIPKHRTGSASQTLSKRGSVQGNEGDVGLTISRVSHILASWQVRQVEVVGGGVLSRCVARALAQGGADHDTNMDLSNNAAEKVLSTSPARGALGPSTDGGQATPVCTYTLSSLSPLNIPPALLNRECRVSGVFYPMRFRPMTLVTEIVRSRSSTP